LRDVLTQHAVDNGRSKDAALSLLHTEQHTRIVGACPFEIRAQFRARAEESRHVVGGCEQCVQECIAAPRAACDHDRLGQIRRHRAQMRDRAPDSRADAALVPGDGAQTRIYSIDDRFYRRFHELWLRCGNVARSRAAE